MTDLKWMPKGERPAEDGYYWFWHKLFDPSLMVVGVQAGFVFFVGDEMHMTMHVRDEQLSDALYCGPIIPPAVEG